MAFFSIAIFLYSLEGLSLQPIPGVSKGLRVELHEARGLMYKPGLDRCSSSLELALSARVPQSGNGQSHTSGRTRLGGLSKQCTVDVSDKGLAGTFVYGRCSAV